MKLTIFIRSFLASIFVFFIASVGFSELNAQGGVWTWMHGSDALSDQSSTYGEKGVSSPLNSPPGKYQAAHWQDKYGMFWMFGGRRINEGLRNDLWKYDPSINEWTWMHGENNPDGEAIYGVKGVPSPANVPPPTGYGALSWYDGNNDLYLYGGRVDGMSNGTNLWKYDIDLNEWTWIDGFGDVVRTIEYGIKGIASADNSPGRRIECESTWFRNDTLWLFGGLGKDIDDVPTKYSDVWIYDLSNNLWTWISGPKGFSELGVPGVMNTHSPLNYPSSRMTHSRWLKDNTFYIYSGNSSGNSNIPRTDLWEYDMNENTWAWIDGSQDMSIPIWGDYCEVDSVHNPGDKLEHQTAQTYIDDRHFFWLYGGLSVQHFLFKNDIWVYQPCNATWTLVWGNPLTNIPPNYGIKGIADLDNVPSARGGACMWTDSDGTIWIYGGYIWGVGETGSDLWKFEPDYTCFDPKCCELTVDIRIGHISSDSIDNGTISINVLEGEGELEYSIDGGYSWIDDNYFQDLPAGDYEVIVRDSSGCIFETLVTILDFSTSILEQENDLSIEIFPNPASDILYYAIGSRDADRVEVFSMKGEEMKCRKADRRIEIIDLPTGLYLLRVQSEGRSGIVKFEKI